MREILRQTQLSGEPWVGDRPEREWALFIASVVDAKLKKMAKRGFQIYRRNTLAIYDNLPLPNVHLGKAIALLRPMIANRWAMVPSFDKLYIEHGPVIAELSATGSRHLELNDLWSYSVTAKQWTWVNGANVAKQPGVFGMRGVAAVGNTPGSRQAAASWVDVNDTLWTFGGYGYDLAGSLLYLNDLWFVVPQ